MSLYMIENDDEHYYFNLGGVQEQDDAAVKFVEWQLFSPECNDSIFKRFRGTINIYLSRLEAEEKEATYGNTNGSETELPGKDLTRTIILYKIKSVANWVTTSKRRDIVTRKADGQNEVIIYNKESSMIYSE